jgi:hypothetical protein
MDKKSGRAIVAKVEQLGGVVMNNDDEQCFLVISGLKDFQRSCNSKCHANLHAIFHVEITILQICHYKHSKLDQ